MHLVVVFIGKDVMFSMVSYPIPKNTNNPAWTTRLSLLPYLRPSLAPEQPRMCQMLPQKVMELADFEPVDPWNY
jgi:hypothetical protein